MPVGSRRAFGLFVDIHLIIFGVIIGISLVEIRPNIHY